MENKMATVITGGTRGIGRAIALKMSANGPVLITGRKEEDAKKVCDEITALGGTAAFCIGDVSDAKLSKLVRQKLEELGWTTANLVINAGISSAGATVSIDHDQWNKMFATNVSGALYVVQELLPSMLKAKAGTIVFMAGMAGVKPYRSMSAYCASKFALVGFAQALSEEVASKGVKCVPVCPAPVDTDMTSAVIEALVKRGATKDDAIAKVAAGSGQKRLLTAAEVADKVSWVCSAEYTAKSGEPVLVTVDEEVTK